MERHIFQMKNPLKRFRHRLISIQLSGVGVIEIILILVIIIGLVLIFRTQITEIMTNAFSSIMGNSTEINSELIIE